MNRNDIITTGGVRTKTKDGTMGIYLPPGIQEGTHRVSITRTSPYGLLIKTDRHPRWINSKWFKEIR